MGIFKRCREQLRHFLKKDFSLGTCLRIFVFSLILLGGFTFFKFQKSEKVPLSSQWRCCVDHRVLLFFSLPGTSTLSPLFLPLVPFTTVENTPFVEVKSQDGKLWKATALQTESVGTLLAELSREIKAKLLPLISIVLDSSGTEYLLLIGTEGQLSLSSMKFLIEHFFIDFKGSPHVEIKTPQEWGYSKSVAFYLQMH